MTDDKHTPSPWDVFDFGENQPFRFGVFQSERGKHFAIARVSLSYDAKLIAAAPEMLELLQELEWKVMYATSAYYCPMCESPRAEGHHGNCKLGKLLERLK
jgi:hypothetical protein